MAYIGSTDCFGSKSQKHDTKWECVGGKIFGRIQVLDKCTDLSV